MIPPDRKLPPDRLAAIAAAADSGAFAVLGLHAGWLRALLPEATGPVLVENSVDQNGAGNPAGTLHAEGAGIFSGPVAGAPPFTLIFSTPAGPRRLIDPYSLPPTLTDFDLYLLAEGTHQDLARRLGAHPATLAGVRGTRFAVWAPNARRVSVVGDFNGWDGRIHQMRPCASGIWEIFLPGIGAGAVYKYALLDRHGALLPLKADPVAWAVEAAPGTASIVADPPLRWTDSAWLADRAARHAVTRPLSIYEVHAGSWIGPGADAPSPSLSRADAPSPSLSRADAPSGWADLAARLVPYVKRMGFTHVEFLPVMAHPFRPSWGYQPLSLFAPMPEFGPPEAFARLVDAFHAEGIGVILDWVPAHFPADAHGLARFDGTALYEHEDPREGYHPDWHTLIYNFGRNEVRGFLVASALHWLEQYHVDGLRVDAVASMLYRDYSRAPDAWIPNRHGGRENLEAVEFLRHLSGVLHARCPGTLLIAEESTAWPGVTAPLATGGLGFDYKWNMGWMHDTLASMAQDPVFRPWAASRISFGLLYAWSEAFILPISHDEVVHGKASLLGKMAGDDWQRFANLRLYLAFLFTQPGKKLLFMGTEFGQMREWNHDAVLDWPLLDDPRHAGVQRLVRDLNGQYRALAALHGADRAPEGFAWLVVDDVAQSVFAWIRRVPPGQGGGVCVAVANFTPVPRHDYRLGLPLPGRWREALNSDAALYGGSNLGNDGQVLAEPHPAHGQAQSARLTLPPLGLLLLVPDPGAGHG